jgi:putative acetyltransferase
MESFTIRRYQPEDAASVADVFYRSVREVAASDYGEAQRTAWMPGLRSAGQIHGWAGDGRLVLVATAGDDRVVAFIDLEADGHVDHLFCAPEAAGRGVAARLCDAVEAAARAQGIGRLYTEASELARRRFERQGYTVLERQDLVVRGVPMHNYRMAKELS